MPSDLWSSYAAGITLRTYQQRALERFQACQHQGSVYLVAPPGAGKTLMGLLMATELGHPAVCLSPNAAIQGQWLARLQQHWVCVDSTLEHFAPHPRSADAPTQEPLALLSLTYQKISVRAGRTTEGEAPGRRFHDNVHALHRQLAAQQVRTVILDECHHLSGLWGEAVEALVAALDAPFVVGLTATPVEQSEGPLARLLGQPDHVISLPSVVRAGDLAPFQDLCHVVAPSADEEEDIRAAQGTFLRLHQRLQVSDEQRFAQGSFWDMVELQPELVGCEDLLQLLAERPDLTMAWCRSRVASGQELPAVLPYLPEAQEAPTLGDQLLLTAHYVAHHLLVEAPQAELTAEATEVLAEWGYQLRPGRVRRQPGRISQVVGFSRQKLRATGHILRTEITNQGPDLRALVITDYENPPEGRPAISCVDVMQLLTSDTVLDELDPILITGTSLLVDDDLWQRFESSCTALCAEQKLELAIDREAEAGYWRLSASGADASTRVLVGLVTHMLEQGVTRCLVGTRALLGEGWDCLRLNTLVDLTVVTSGVAVNQIRGRTMRQDPDAPLKLANNWDVLCLSSIGDPTELERLHRRHDKLYGITDDGQVERGIGHIHASFDRVSVWELYAEREQLNRMMHQRAADRAGAWKRWRVGSEWHDVDLTVLSFSAPRRRPAARPSAAADERAAQVAEPTGSTDTDGPEAAPRQEVLLSPARRQRTRRRAVTTAAVGAVATGALGALGAILWPPLAAAALVPAVGALWRLRRLARLTPTDLGQELSSLARVLLEALRLPAEEIAITRRDDGTLRVVWDATDSEQNERLTRALAELLGPVVGQRYLLVEPLWRPPAAGLGAAFGKGGAEQRVFGVPRALGRSSSAKRLLGCWRELRNGEAQLHHRDSEQGQALLARALRQAPLRGEAAIRTVWR